MDSIYALSSGAVPAGVAVVRLSGSLAGKALVALCGRIPEPRRAELRVLRRPDDGLAIDQGLVLWFPGPRSETGEDMAELQVHGSRAVLRALFDELSALGLRLAEPGEFIKRAFLNAKLDLTGVEGLADLVAAETEVQRRQALGQARGALAMRAEGWRQALIGLRAEIEARLDFSDEGDVSEDLPKEFWEKLGALRSQMQEALAGAVDGERVREGFRVAILGRPNAGKSSLLNALAKRDVAIVTPEPGTTRDVLEVPLDLGGYPVLLYDTAGLRDADSVAEVEGVRRAERIAGAADLVIWLDDATMPAESAPPVPPDTTVWGVPTKIDLVDGHPARGISSLTGAGIPELVTRLGAAAAEGLGAGTAIVTRRRQVEAMTEALAAIQAVTGVPEEVAADLLRSAGDSIGRLTGRIDVEDVLDRLFAEFCIGK